MSDEGVADLSLRGYSGQLTPEASELMITQLAWTLGQEPGIEAIRVSIGGQPITSATGQSLFDVNEQSEYDPTGLDSSSLFYGLRDGLLVSQGSPTRWLLWWPDGHPDVGVRSIAVNLDGTIVAAVSGRAHPSSSLRARPPATGRGGRQRRATTCSGRPGTWPTGCGWWTRPPAARSSPWSTASGRARSTSRGLSGDG